MAKNEYFKKRIITFGNTPIETMYVDFGPPSALDPN